MDALTWPAMVMLWMVRDRNYPTCNDHAKPPAFEPSSRRRHSLPMQPFHHIGMRPHHRQPPHLL